MKGEIQKKKPFKKNRGRNNYRKDNFEPKDSVPKSIHNDAEWYVPTQQLLKDVSTISFNTALGAPVTLRSSSAFKADCDFPVPGIMTIYTVPSIGISTSGPNANSAPVNYAATALMNQVREANSGAKNYDKADLMLYLLSMDSIYTYWAFMVRAYGVCNLFNAENRYVGDSLLRAMGVSPAIRNDLAQFRTYINQYAIRAMGRYVPDVFTYFKRHAFMYQNVYMDEDVNKCQFYMYAPAFLYKYSRDPEDERGILIPQGGPNVPTLSASYVNGKFTARNANNGHTLTTLRNYGDALLNAMFDDEDTAIIGGDLMKAFGAERRYNLVQIDETYATFPAFSEEMLAQFHNTNFAGVEPVTGTYEGGWVDTLDTFIVSQNANVDTGELLFSPAFKDIPALTYSKILDSWKQDPGPEWVMTSTRGMLAAEEFTSSESGSAYFLRACGSEIALFASVLVNRAGVPSLYDMFNQSIADPSKVSVYTKFNEAPIWYTCNASGNLDAVSGALANFAVISEQQLIDLHSTALMGLFSIR